MPSNSVCPSVTCVHRIKMVEPIKILSLSDRPIILVFHHQGLFRKSDSFTPNRVPKYKGIVISDDYAAISWKQ